MTSSPCPISRSMRAEIELAGLDHEIVVAAGAAGALHAELARGIVAEEIALDRRRERSSGCGWRPLPRRTRCSPCRRAPAAAPRCAPAAHLPAEAVGEERGLAIEVAAVYPEMKWPIRPTPPAPRTVPAPGGGYLAAAQARQRPLSGVAAERAGFGDPLRHARGAVPVVALHEAPCACNTEQAR